MCLILNDRARLIIEHTTDFALSGNIDGPCNLTIDLRPKSPRSLAVYRLDYVCHEQYERISTSI